MCGGGDGESATWTSNCAFGFSFLKVILEGDFDV